MTFTLGSLPDLDGLRQQFADVRYAHVKPILPDDMARKLRNVMLEGTPWSQVFNDRDKHIDMSTAQLAALSGEQGTRLQKAIYAQAQNGFQYCYNNYPIFDVCRAGKNEGHLLHTFYEWLNGEEFLGFARTVTGFDDISFADAQATCYLPGHFLTCHDDSHDSKKRRAAYVFNFTQDWPTDWGGYLQLLDDDYHIRRGFKPTFNALNIFAVPQKHNVSMVAPFAGGQRLSITGWLRYGAPD